MTTSAGTFANEDGLPRVPLPTLEDSCRRFLEWCAPLLNADELDQTRQAVETFLAPSSTAHALQDELKRYDATPGVRSWLDQFWPSRYLGRRDRIALNANFFFLFADDEQASQPRRAAGLIMGALAYKSLIDGETLPPVVVRDVPHSMEQQKSLFSATRIPGHEQDTVRAPYTTDWPGPSRARHIVVWWRGRPHRLDVIGPEGAPHTLDEIETGLRELQAASTASQSGTSVGHLTTLARAEWAAERERLVSSDPQSIEAIETALFCVCLDDISPADAHAACEQLLTGDSGNRWFDKALSFIVFTDGRAGINVEHLGLDGTTILALTDFILGTQADEHAQTASARTQGSPVGQRIEFSLDDGQRKTIARAEREFDDFVAASAFRSVAFEQFGADDIKQLGVSPDAFAQLSYQLAHRRAKGLTGATYESIATRQFRGGRTEAMRVVTPEMVEYVEAMEDPQSSPAERVRAVRAAAEAHVARAVQCQQGDAPEQHLWELQLIAQRSGMRPNLALYDSPGWHVMRADYLSTSSAPSDQIQYFGFGSTSAQCIGVAYVLLPHRWHLFLSTPGTEVEGMAAFAETLPEVVAELRSLLGDST